MYPFLFALAAMNDVEKALVFEIDVSRLEAGRMEPDEDAIAQAIAMKDNRPLEAVHAQVRRSFAGYRHLWRESLQALGCCAHRGTIPPEAITRYCIFNPRARSSGELALAISDAQVSIMNHRFCGDKYAGLVQWMFGDRDGLLCLAWPAVAEQLGDLWTRIKESWDREARDRGGIEVVTLRSSGPAEE